MMDPITKIDAAERQLVAAVRMFFNGWNPVPIYTLAAASREILSTLLEKSKERSFLDLGSEAIGWSRRDVARAVHEHACFFKHADRDPEAVLIDFDETHVDAVLFAACHDFQRVAGGGPVEVQVFEFWFLALHETSLTPEAEFVTAIREVFPDIKTLSRQKQLRLGREALNWALHQPDAKGSYTRIYARPPIGSR